MLIDYPVKFGDEEIPEPEEWSEESSVIENVNQTEAGTDQISVTRYGKAHFFYSWRLEANDPLPEGKKPCLSLREMEKQYRRDTRQW